MATLFKVIPRSSFTFYKLSQTRTIMSTASRCQKVMEDLENNPYFEKYASKIASLQQTSPEEFLSRIEEREKQKIKKVEPTDRQYSSLVKPKTQTIEKLEGSGEESLSKIMKIELLENKSAEEIKEIWLKYHSQKEVIAATIPAKDFDELERKSYDYPTFLLALPRSQGYEFMMSQFERHTVHLTPLLYYQVHKENAPECLTIHHYTEFKDSKGIVLMRGVFDTNIINVQEAQCLANQLLLYYVQNDPNKAKLLDVFTNSPDHFKHMDLVKEIENLSLK